jgi:hypothetical protein
MEKEQLELLTRVMDKLGTPKESKDRITEAIAEWVDSNVPMDKELLSLVLVVFGKPGMGMSDLVTVTGISYQLGWLAGKKAGASKA